MNMNVYENISESINQSTIFNKFERYSIVFCYAFIFLLSMFGNTTILIVICHKKGMYTPNNYFLANITISNLIYTLCAPFPFIIEINEKNGEWLYPDLMCPILPFTNTFAVNLNTLTMTISSLDRLISIIFPFKTKLSKKKCIFIISMIWILSIVFALPWGILMRIQFDNFLSYESINSSLFEDINYDDNITTSIGASTVKICFPLEKFSQILRSYFFILNLIQYVLPMSSLLVTYSIITYYVNIINANRMHTDVNKSNNQLRKKNENKLFKMHVLMLVCFNVCWLPFQLNAFLFVIDPLLFSNKASPFAAKISWMASHWFAFCHFCLNPYLTGFLNVNFREQIKILFLRKYSTDRQYLMSTFKGSQQLKNHALVMNLNNKKFNKSNLVINQKHIRKLSKPTNTQEIHQMSFSVNYSNAKNRCLLH